jgi:cytochrome c peroxidase
VLLTRRAVAVGVLLAFAALSLAAPRSGSPPAYRSFAAVGDVPIPGDVKRNRQRLAGLVAEAHRRGARYVVLPELGLVGSLAVSATMAAPWALAEPVPGPTTDFFSRQARELGIWLAVSLPERNGDGPGFFLTTVLLDDRGEIASRYRKILVRPESDDGPAARGSFRDILDTVDDHGLRLGILAGSDLQVGVPRLASRGAEVILVAADWTDHEPVAWDEVCRQLSRDHAVQLVVANRRPAVGAAATGRWPAGGIFTPKGDAALQTADGPLSVADLPRRESSWRIETAMGLPGSIPVPADAPATPEIAELGRKLFFDKGLSSNGQVSCGSCHQPERAFTNGEATGTGVDGRKTYRNVPSLLNVAFRPLLRWDGYASTLENFAKYPVSGYNEMNFHYLDDAVRYVRSQPAYVAAFHSTMGVDEIQFDDVARALSTYERTLVSGNSPFDRYYYGGERSALDASARRGLALFTGSAGCARCHRIGDRYALFTDLAYHSLGIGYSAEPGRSVDIGLGAISTNDLAGFFQTPSLRNVAATAPYMHDGSLRTLEAVVDFYDHGGLPSHDPANGLRRLDLSEQAKRDLIAFLRSLTGDQNYDAEGRRLSPRGRQGGTAVTTR